MASRKEAIYLVPKPGKRYDLRDVECNDNSVAGISLNDPLSDANPELAGGPCGEIAGPVFG